MPVMKRIIAIASSAGIVAIVPSTSTPSTPRSALVHGHILARCCKRRVLINVLSEPLLGEDAGQCSREVEDEACEEEHVDECV